MNAKTINSQLKANNLDPQNFTIERGTGYYFITYRNFGISDNLRQRMTGDQVNRKRQNDKIMLEKVAQIFGGRIDVNMVWVNR